MERLTVESVEAQHVNVGDEVWAHNRFRCVESAGPMDAVTDRISLEFRAEEVHGGLFAAVVQSSDKVLRLPALSTPSGPWSGPMDGRALYHRWCGSTTSDRALDYNLMNPAEARDWERLAAELNAERPAAPSPDAGE